MNIKEMAKEYAKHNPSIIDGGDGRFEYDYESPRLDYIAGANAVLEKIEKCLDDEDCVSRILSNYEDIKEIVLELKGE